MLPAQRRSRNPVVGFPKAPAGGWRWQRACATGRNHRCGKSVAATSASLAWRTECMRGDLCFGRPHTGFLWGGVPRNLATETAAARQAGSKTTPEFVEQRGQWTFGRPGEPRLAAKQPAAAESALVWRGPVRPPPHHPWRRQSTPTGLGIEPAEARTNGIKDGLAPAGE